MNIKEKDKRLIEIGLEYNSIAKRINEKVNFRNKRNERLSDEDLEELIPLNKRISELALEMKRLLENK